MEKDEVILVDANDQPTGVAEKLLAHRQGLLHRAFSIFIFNSSGEMLLQQRAMNKYHSGGAWSNACCSHPRPGETIQEAAKRRLQEEMGIVTPLEKIFDFIYRAGLDNGFTEHEFDHVLAGIYDGKINADKDEVKDFGYVSPEKIKQELLDNPQQYSVWFRLAFPQAVEWWNRQHQTSNLKPQTSNATGPDPVA